MCCSPKPCFCAQPRTSHRRAPAEKPPNPSPPLELQLQSAGCPARLCSWHSGPGLEGPLSPLQQGVTLRSRERPAHQEGRWLLTGMFTPHLEARQQRCQGPGGSRVSDTGTETGSTELAASLAGESQSERARKSTPVQRAGTGEGGSTAGLPLSLDRQPKQSYFTQNLNTGQGWAPTVPD